MFENLDYITLQQYWWAIISLLAALLVFLLFVQGGQTFIFSMGKDETKKNIIINAVGRKWEFTFTTLVTFGGAFFASFPLFYSTSFGGAYWAWITLLFCFVIQAVAFEYRRKPNNFLGTKTFDLFLLINGIGATLLIGTVVATFFTGANFTVNDINQSHWNHPMAGLEAALSLHNLSLGLAVLFLSRTLALQYFTNVVDDSELLSEVKKRLPINSILFLIFFLTFVIWLMFIDGAAYSSESGIVVMESYKYLHNLLEMPINSIILVVGVVLVLLGIALSIFKGSKRAIIPTGVGTVLTVFALLIMAGYNNTCYYPSLTDLQSSLNIENSSSSLFTLKTMSYASLAIPVVLAYIVYAWRAINVKDLTAFEIDDKDEEAHIY